MSKWRKIRIVLWILCFIQGVLGGALVLNTELAKEPFIFKLLLIIVPLIITPFALLAVISFQVVNPLQDKKWTLPNLDSNFLKLSDPLHFFHAVAHIISATGLGTMVGSLFDDFTNFIVGLAMLSGSLSALLGVKLCTIVFSSKFQEEKTPAAAVAKEPVRSKTAKVIGIFILACSIIPFAHGIYSFANTKNFLMKAVKTKGKVLDLKEYSSGDGVVYRPVFSFMDNAGNNHTIHSTWGSNPPRYGIGDSVSVLYDPEEPENAKTDSFFDLWLYSIIGVFGGIVCVFMGLLYLSIAPVIIRKKRLKRPREA